MKKSTQILCFLLSLIIIYCAPGCSGGGGGDNGSSNGTAPKIMDATAWKLGEYGGPYPAGRFSVGDKIGFMVDAWDPDLDMTTGISDLHFETNDGWMQTGTTTVDLPAQPHPDTRYNVGESTVEGPPGNYERCFFIVDAAGNESNEYCIDLTVHDL